MADFETKLDMLNSHAMLCNWIFAIEHKGSAEYFIHEDISYFKIQFSTEGEPKLFVSPHKFLIALTGALYVITLGGALLFLSFFTKVGILSQPT